MKQYVIIGIAVFVFYYFFVALPARAEITTMQNDSNSIILPPSAGGGTGSSGSSGDTSGFSGSDAGGGGNNSGGTDDTSSVGIFVTGADGSIIVIIGGGPAGGSGTPGGGVGGHNNTTLITTLTSGDNGLTFTDTGGSFAGSGYSSSAPAIVSGVGAGSFIISGSKLRAALIAKGITAINVAGWDYDDAFYTDDSAGYLREASLTPEDVAVIASAAVFNDQHIEQVTLSGDRLSITYKTKGWLLYFIPITFTVTLNINAAEQSPQDRVIAIYPWYRIFTWLPISPNELAADINAAIVGNNAAGLSSSETQARLFSQVSTLLKTRAGADETLLTP